MNLSDTTRSRISFTVLAGIGLVGFLGQASILRNSLVHSYPYKMMSVPPAEFYALVGNWGYYLSVCVAIVGLTLSIKLARWLAAVVPVILCPLVYWLTFEIAHLIHEFGSNEMMVRNFEGYTGNTVRYEFAFAAFWLMFFGAVIVTIAGVLITNFRLPDLTDWHKL